MNDVLYSKHLKGVYMSTLLANRYKYNKAKAEANVKKEKELHAEQTKTNKKETKKTTVVENIQVAKEPRVLPLD